VSWRDETFEIGPVGLPLPRASLAPKLPPPPLFRSLPNRCHLLSVILGIFLNHERFWERDYLTHPSSLLSPETQPLFSGPLSTTVVYPRGTIRPIFSPPISSMKELILRREGNLPPLLLSWTVNVFLFLSHRSISWLNKFMFSFPSWLPDLLFLVLFRWFACA